MFSYLADFISLFYPTYCNGCGRTLIRGEKHLCCHCLSNLPKTDFHTYKNNPIEMIFAGRVPIFRATSFCFFRYGNVIQTVVHQLKYNKNQAIGTYMGYLLGSYLLKEKEFASIDIILPIPLHPNKRKKRGYNQSECIGKGLAKIMSKEMDTTSLIRTVETSSQTKKTRYERVENTSGIFQVTSSEKLTNKHILLIDDVITTGATIESATQQLVSLIGTKVSVASLAYTT
jgi:ComF family protein